jgi:uncharacterized protein (TIGR03435 family)
MHHLHRTRARLVTTLASTTVLLLALASGRVEAQSTLDPLRFEVASVKPHIDNGGTAAGIEESQSSVRIANLPLRTVIAIAYDVMDSRVVGPGWIERRTFDIVAKPPARYERAQLATLLRNLLADRFRLVAHDEKREVHGYALRVEKDGHKLRAATGPRTFLTGRAGLIAGNGRSMSEIAPLLSQMVRATVVDETALKDAYDIRLEWTPSLASPATVAAEPEVSLFTALREQLGLRLEPVKAVAQFVIVDRVDETPTPD